MRKISFFAPLWLLSFIVLSSCGGHGGGSTGLPGLSTIAVTPAGAAGAPPGIVISPGTSLHFVATADYTDGTTKDITADVMWTWSSTDTGVATISNDPGYKGLLTALNAGTVKVTATFDGIPGSATLSINPARGNSWKIKSFDNALLGIGWNGSQFVATGDSGIILTSPTGTTWTRRISGTTEALWAVASGTSVNVAVGSNGAILTSSDLISWTSQSSGTSNFLWGVAWSGSQFIATGETGTILDSSDGISWTPATSGVTSNLNGVACKDDTLCVAVGQNNTLLFRVGGTWAPGLCTNCTSTESSEYLWGVAWAPLGTNKSRFVAVGSNGAILYSDASGANWTRALSGTTLYLDRVAWSPGKNLFTTVGQNGIVLTSPDGITWTHRISNTTNFLWDVASNGTTTPSRIVAVGLNGNISSSVDGVTWAATSSATTDTINSVAWSGTEFAAVGDNGTVLTSFKGARWNLESSGTTTTLNSVTALGAQFIAVGDAGTVVTSPFTSSTGTTYTTWTSLSSGTTNTLNGVATNWSPRQPLPVSPEFVAVGAAGTILTSPDGITWATQTSGTKDLNGVAWSGSLLLAQPIFVAVGNGGTILFSTDNGSTWNLPATNSLSLLDLINVTWSGSEFVASDSSGATHVSLNGTSW
jgi:hypothetical protein